MRIGWSSGLFLRNDGGDGMPAGSSGIAAAIAVCTSTAALSMSRFEVELQRDVGAARAAARRHRVEAGDRRELALERARDRRRHRARIAAGQAGADVQRRVVDLRQVADRQRAIGDDAEQRDRRHQQAGGDRPPDEDFGEVHSGTPLLAGSAAAPCALPPCALPRRRRGRRVRPPAPRAVRIAS